MDKLSDFMRRKFAEKLKVPVEEVEELYTFVQEHFFLSVNSRQQPPAEKPKLFYTRLWFKDDEDAYIIAEFDRKAPLSSPAEALDKTLNRVTDTVFSYFKYFPTNILILFDTKRERKRIMAESWYFK